jgi:hypothetical protein
VFYSTGDLLPMQDVLRLVDMSLQPVAVIVNRIDF